MFGDHVIRAGIALAVWCRVMAWLEPRTEIAFEYRRFASWLEKTTEAFTMELNFIRSLSADEMDRLGVIEERLRRGNG